MKVIYEDNHLLVVEKPYGIPSQADSSGDDDMLTLCKAYIKEKYDKPGKVYLGLVHRLDRPTQGVMVFARTSKAAARITKQIQTGEFSKTYLAVLSNTPEERCAELWDYLAKDSKQRIARVTEIDVPGAKKAGLRYEVLGKKDGMCLVKIKLLTGRFHQIRAQFANVGCSVYGDMKYGKRDIKDELALFASEVCLDHPTKGERMCFSAKPTRYPFLLFE